MSFFKWLKDVIKGDKKRGNRISYNKANTFKNNNLMLALEPRYLYDAAGLAAGLLGMEMGNGELGIGNWESGIDSFSHASLPISHLQTPREIVFVDPTVKDYEKIINPEGFQKASGFVDLVVLDPNQDGVEQISVALDSYAHVDAVHIVSHGGEGYISLGNAALGVDTIEGYAPLLRGWNLHLNENADILIYGCNVAAGVEGAAFVNRLADLTGADAAASDNITGADSLGGDWELEYATGAVETVAMGGEGYEYSLATIIVDTIVDENDGSIIDGDISLRDAIANANAGDTIDLTNLSGTIYLTTGTEIAITKNMSIIGPGAGTLTIDADKDPGTAGNQATSRIFNIDNGITASIYDLTLTNGKAGGLNGGAIFNNGTLNIYYSTITESTATYGGGIFNNSGDTLNIYNCTIKSNTATQNNMAGGGIYTSGTLNISNPSDISLNISGTVSNNIQGTTTSTNDTPSFTSTEVVSVSETESYTYNITTNDANADSLTISSIMKPTWLTSFTDNTDGTATLSGTPNIGDGNATYDVVLRVQDTHGAYSDQSFTITVNALPVLTVGGTLAYTENDSATVINSGITLTDADSDITGATVTITGGTLTEDILSATDSGGITSSYNSGTGILTLSGTDSATNYETVLNTVKYQNTNGDNPDESARTITFSLTDGGPGVTDTATITVTAVNDAPENTVPGSQSINEDDTTPLTFSTGNGNLIKIDDVDAGSSSVKVTLTGTNGTITLNGTTSLAFTSGDGTDDAGLTFTGTVANINTALDGMTFTPTADYNGTGASVKIDTDDQGYTGSGGAKTDSNTVNVTVDSVNDAPSFTTGANQTVSEDSGTKTIGGWATAISKGAANESGQTLTFQISNDNTSLFSVQPAIDTSGTLTYTPAPDQNGSATVTVTLKDNGGTANGGFDTSASQSFTITVNSVNDAPVALDDVYSATENTLLNGNSVLGNDSDFHSGAPNENNTLLTAQLVSNVSHGTLTLDTNGTFIYTPATNFNGSDSFTYQAKDSLGGVSNTATVTINVGGVNQSPVATNDSYSTNEDTLLNAGMSVLANDSDSHGGAPGEDNIPLSIGQIVSGVSDGTLIMNYSDGTFTYTPNANFYGTDTFTYKAKDSLGGESNIATATINVISVNDPPKGTNQSISTNEDIQYNGAATGTDVEVDTLTYSKETDPSHGTVVINPDGSFSYKPELNYFGFDSFKFRVEDTSGASGIGIVSITVNSVNDVPVSQNKTVTTNEDAPYSGTLTATDIENDSLAFSKANNPLHGSALVNADGTFTYTPAAGYFGPDSFTFAVSDGKGGNSTGTVNVTVTEVADPNANDDVLSSISEDTQLTFTKATLLSNDTDVNNISSWTQPLNGTLNFNGTTFTYKPNPNFYGNNSFQYTASNNSGATDNATVYITVTSVNDTPAFTSTPVTSVNQDTSYSYSITTSDPDDAGNYLTISALIKPDWLTFTYHNNGTATLSGTPANSEVGYHGVKIQVRDDDGAVSDQTFTITVNNENDPPDANDFSVATKEEVPVKLDFKSHISDPDNDPLTISFNQPNNGTVFFNGTEYTYTPYPFYNGSEGFTYTVSDGKLTDTATVTITVESVNTPPDALGFSAFAKKNSEITIDLSKYASDPDNDPLIFTTAIPSHGTLGKAGNGIYTYTPSTNYVGTDTFTYTVSDGKISDTADITINITDKVSPPTALNDTLTINKNNILTFADTELLRNDIDPDGDTLFITSFTQPLYGKLYGNGDRTYTYIPNSGYSGQDIFTYTISDGDPKTNDATAKVTITVNSPPVASDDIDKGTSLYLTTNKNATLTIASDYLLKNDSDPDGNKLSVEGFLKQPLYGTLFYDKRGGVFTYTPSSYFSGTDSFVYKISDGKGGEDFATATLFVNNPPIAEDDSFTIAKNTDLIIDKDVLLENDSDIENHLLNIKEIRTVPLHGILEDHDDGTYTYTPEIGFSGADTFIYTVADTKGGLDNSTVTITVENHAPVVKDDGPFTIQMNSAIPLTIKENKLTENDSDLDGDKPTIESFTQTSYGSLIRKDGSFIYTPNTDYYGDDTFTYTVSDGDGGTATATVRIFVNAPPYAVDDTSETNKNTPVDISLLDNDTDPNGDTLSVKSIIQSPSHGNVAYKGIGIYTYTPATNYAGTDSFTYQASDGKGGTDTAAVNITIKTNPPVAVADNLSTNEDTPMTITTSMLKANDHDPDGDSVSVTQITTGKLSHGNLVAKNGSYIYTSDLNYNGSDTFTYTLSDGDKNTSDATGTVMIEIKPVNDAPVANGDTIGTNENAVQTFSDEKLLGNDTDADNDPALNQHLNAIPNILTLKDFTQPIYGSLTYDNDTHLFTYAPGANYSGSDSFTYTVEDGKSGISEKAIVRITVNGDPDARDDYFSMQMNTSLKIETANTEKDLLVNDTDPEGDMLTVSIDDSTSSKGGSVADNGDGTLTYLPAANYYGTDTFTYKVSDGNGGTDTAIVHIKVNAPPIPSDDEIIVDKNTPKTITPFINDKNPDNDALTVTNTTPSFGTLTDKGNGVFIYTPDTDYTGSDSFNYTVSDGKGGIGTAKVHITVKNKEPIAKDDHLSTDEDTNLIIQKADILGNDSDPDGDSLTITKTDTTYMFGRLTDNQNGTYTYEPYRDYNGTDSFFYEISDGTATATAKVHITVNPINDPPEANDDKVFVIQDTELGFTVADLLKNDTDVDGDVITLTDIEFTSPEHGIFILNDDGESLYMPDKGYYGTDAFSYQITDGNGAYDIGTVNIMVVHDLPNPGTRIKNDYVAIKQDTTLFMIAEDFDIKGYTSPSHGKFALDKESGFYTYTPTDENFSGEDAFVIKTSGGKIRMFVDVMPNESPIGKADNLSTLKNTELSFTSDTLLANDTDAENDPLNVTGFTAPEHGMLYHIKESDEYIYTPDADYIGQDNFLYTVSDGNGGMDPVRVNIEVKGDTSDSEMTQQSVIPDFSAQIRMTSDRFETERATILSSLGMF